MGISNDQIRYFVTKGGESNRYLTDEGTTIDEMLSDELCIHNFKKINVFRNGEFLDPEDYDDEIVEGDKFEIRPANFDSGC